MAGPINLGQAFPNGLDDGFCLVCWTGAQDRLGDVLHSPGHRGGERGGTRPPPTAPPPQPPPPSWVWRCCCRGAKDASSRSSWSSWAPGSSSYHSGTIAVLHPQNLPLKPVQHPSPATDDQRLCHSRSGCCRWSVGMGKAWRPSVVNSGGKKPKAPTAWGLSRLRLH